MNAKIEASTADLCRWRSSPSGTYVYSRKLWISCKNFRTQTRFICAFTFCSLRSTKDTISFLIVLRHLASNKVEKRFRNSGQSKRRYKTQKWRRKKFLSADPFEDRNERNRICLSNTLYRPVSVNQRLTNMLRSMFHRDRPDYCTKFLFINSSYKL